MWGGWRAERNWAHKELRAEIKVEVRRRILAAVQSNMAEGLQKQGRLVKGLKEKAAPLPAMLRTGAGWVAGANGFRTRIQQYLGEISGKPQYPFGPGPPWVCPPKATPEAVAQLEQEFSQEEVWGAVMKQGSSKAPGETGVTGKMLKALGQEVVAPILTRVVNAAWKGAKLPQQWLTGVVCLIHKGTKGGPREELSSYRPITLLEVPYKVYTALINRRLMRLMEDEGLWAEAQGGFREGRSTTDNIWDLSLALLAANKGKEPVAGMFIDFAQAYDSVDWGALQAVIQLHGLGNRLAQAVLNMYEGALVRGITPYGLTETVKVQVGVRQGDPLSTTLFNLAINPLLWALAQEEGLAFGVRRSTVLAYADDIVIVVRSFDQLQRLLGRVEEYGAQVNLRVKAKKCGVFSLGQEAPPMALASGELLPHTHGCTLYHIHMQIHFFAQLPVNLHILLHLRLIVSPHNYIVCICQWGTTRCPPLHLPQHRVHQHVKQHWTHWVPLPCPPSRLHCGSQTPSGNRLHRGPPVELHDALTTGR